MENVIFIAGPGRSGTSVTRKLLARHSQITALPFENRFIIDPDGIADFYCTYTSSWSPYLADRRIKRLEKMLLNLSYDNPFHKFLGKILKRIDKKGSFISSQIYTGWELAKHISDFEKYVNELISELRDFSYPGVWRGSESYQFFPRLYYGGPKSRAELAEILRKFLKKTISSLLKKSNAKVYVEDTPWNLLFAKELLQLLPCSKILHVLRDPRDVVASFCQQPWSPKNLNQAIIYYKDILQCWLSIEPEIPSNNYFEFKLENLVRDPVFVAKQVCAFVGLPYEDQMTNLDLGKSHTGRWKKDFSDGEKKQLEKELKEIVQKLGYE